MDTTTPKTAETPGPQIRREEFAATETRALVETASAAVSAQAQALVQARYIVALQRPRGWDVVRSKLLRDCQRTEFAKAALYRKPIGDEGGVEGLSIRFAEAALRHMGNIFEDTMTVYDDDQKRIVHISVTDLESNAAYGQSVTIPKTVERKKLQREQVPLSARYNSKGQRVYTVAATDDDILNKVNALISKSIRTQGLRLVPADIKEDCLKEIKKTRASEIEKDPEAARKQIIDAFMGINVPPDQLQEYLGHDLATCSPAELDDLRSLFAAIRDGEATWAEAMDSVSPGNAEGSGSGEGAPPDRGSSLREKLAARRPNGNGTAPAASAAPERPAETLASRKPTLSDLPATITKTFMNKVNAFPAEHRERAQAGVLSMLVSTFGPFGTWKGDAVKCAEAMAAVKAWTLA